MRTFEYILLAIAALVVTFGIADAAIDLIQTGFERGTIALESRA